MTKITNYSCIVINIKLTISYDGTRYSGWQIQKNARTIQAEIEKALRKILRKRIRITGAGRTDAGVHAKGQVANFHTDKKIPLKNLRSALNTYLPPEMSILRAKWVKAAFHSQFDAIEKKYRYTVFQGDADNPFLRPYYYKFSGKLDIRQMKKEARSLVGKHDFRAFQAKAASSKLKSTVRAIKSISVSKKGRFIFIDITADGFLHNMVRVIAGTLIEAGRGHMLPGSTKRILASGSRKAAGPTVPSKGLSLISIKY
ncbi:MAG: tRNA pseudouridine(38-40) synthase TruA [Candidatus Omnitrophica bacterium]|nr:tRNA pseudouridine(38-40) synthase TruA [Candidatus Omnitrophota bacterium]